MAAALIFVISAAICAALTWVVRRHAIKRQILDHPNERSSHVMATPRGGGLAIAATVLGGTLLMAILGLVDVGLTTAIVGGGSAIALIGWLDDLGKASVLLRLAVQTAAAAGAVIALGGMPAPLLGTTPIHLGVAGSILATVSIIWCTNLYNFMDGIDGLAASEAVTVAGVGAGLALLSGQQPLGGVLAALAGAAVGFLIWNWQPARIFMGDVGSGLIGFILGCCVVAAQRGHAISITVWLVLLLVFLADATVTLIRRLHAREALHVAHRKHAYQRAVQAGWSHQRVTGAILGINTVLAILAAAIWRKPVLTAILLTIAVAIIGIAYGLVERAYPMYASRQR